jgi:hypothetical protein
MCYYSLCLCLQILHTLFQWLCLLAIESLFCLNCFSVWFQVTSIIALKISNFKPWWHCFMKCCGSRTDLYIIMWSTKWTASQDGRSSSFINLKIYFYLTIIKNYFHSQEWIQHDLVGGGGVALPALVPSCVGHVCRPPINLLHYCKLKSCLTTAFEL